MPEEASSVVGGFPSPQIGPRNGGLKVEGEGGWGAGRAKQPCTSSDASPLLGIDRLLLYVEVTRRHRE